MTIRETYNIGVPWARTERGLTLAFEMAVLEGTT